MLSLEYYFGSQMAFHFSFVLCIESFDGRSYEVVIPSSVEFLV